jgi:uncharacterized protein (TIGR01777 family)
MFEHVSEVDAPVSEVFDWHAAPGALRRLAPPWQPVRILRESASLRDGSAVLALPGGLRWIAQHRPDGYRPPHAFVDELTSWPLAPMLRWRHRHVFEDTGEGSTRVIDSVDSRLPDAMLRQMFAYRERQLAADLATHRWARDIHPETLTVAVTGSSGLVGSALCALLTTGGHRVIRLVRKPAGRDDGRGGAPAARYWNPADPAPDLLDGVDAVVHLAGAPIAGRFTDAHRSDIEDSRVGPMRRLAILVARAAEAGHAVRLVSASAVGYYGPDRGDEVLGEAAERGDGFLADVVARWEAATGPAEEAGAPVVRMRTGIVQTPAGGTLRLLRPLFAAGLGGRLGDGRQWTAWIGLDDLLDVYLRAIVDPNLRGAVNAVAPGPVRNSEYTAVLARVLRRPAVLPTPSFGPRLLLGDEGARELALAGQRAVPARLTAAGHRFRYSSLEPALRHLLGRVALPSAG